MDNKLKTGRPRKDFDSKITVSSYQPLRQAIETWGASQFPQQSLTDVLNRALTEFCIRHEIKLPEDLSAYPSLEAAVRSLTEEVSLA